MQNNVPALGFPDAVSAHCGIDVIGENCRISSSVTVMRYGLLDDIAVTLGNGVVLFDNARLVVGDTTLAGKSYIKMGNDVIVNVGCYLSGEGGLEIEDDVLIGPHVKIYSAGHVIYGGNESIRRNPINYGKTIIKSGAWIGGGGTILQGVSIGEGAVVGAGSVVTKDVPAYAVVVGNPAAVVNYRDVGGNNYRPGVFGIKKILSFLAKIKRFIVK